MADLIGSLTDPNVAVSVLASIAVFATIVTLAMPMLQRDEFSTRMKSVATEREKIRARERARLAEQSKKGSLKQPTLMVRECRYRLAVYHNRHPLKLSEDVQQWQLEQQPLLRALHVAASAA